MNTNWFKAVWEIIVGLCQNHVKHKLILLAKCRIVVGDAFAHPSRQAPPPPTTYAMGTGSFPGVKRPGRGVDHPPPSSAEVKEKVQLYL
jgi:hypothetical protein